MCGDHDDGRVGFFLLEVLAVDGVLVHIYHRLCVVARRIAVA